MKLNAVEIRKNHPTVIKEPHRKVLKVWITIRPCNQQRNGHAHDTLKLSACTVHLNSDPLSVITDTPGDKS